MQHADTPSMNDASLARSDEATLSGRSTAARKGRQRGEAPDLVAGYMERIGRGELLTKEEEATLAREARAGNGRARSRLVEKNLRLVVSVAARYRGMGLAFEDLIQEGNIGLMKAIERYDPDLGNRFSTYATWWIRQAVGRALSDKGRTIRLPVHTGEQVRELTRTRSELLADLGRAPSNVEVAERLGWTAGKVGALVGLAQDVASLDRPMGAETGASELGQIIEDEHAADVAEAVVRQMEDVRLRKSLQEMSDRERRVLVRRYGLDDEEPAPLSELSAELGISRERVRQLQRSAERRLRALSAPEPRREDASGNTRSV